MSMHVCKVRPRKDKRGVDLISDGAAVRSALVPRTTAATGAIGYAKPYNRLHDAVIRVYDAPGTVICIVRTISSTTR
jgi:hypothetical protein